MTGPVCRCRHHVSDHGRDGVCRCLGINVENRLYQHRRCPCVRPVPVGGVVGLHPDLFEEQDTAVLA